MDRPEPDTPGHARNKSSAKATRPRSSTKGPLDVDDGSVVSPTVPSAGVMPVLTPPRHAATSLADRTPARYLPRRPSPGPSGLSPGLSPRLSPGRPGLASGSPGPGRRTDRPGPPAAGGKPKKDFSYLLRPEIYHPLPLTSVPPPFRTAAHMQPDPDTPLEDLLAAGRFRAAAVAAAQQLTGSGGGSSTAPRVDPTDAPRIFDLLYTRLACLLLIDATSLAAQEGKALEDLNSPFYRGEVETDNDDNEKSPPPHLVPWPLRVLNIRLQALGFGDPRRAVMSYYELAREARAHIAAAAAAARHERPDHTAAAAASAALWTDRLAELGIQVAGALIEMEDLTGAAAHLASMGSSSSSSSSESTSAAARRIAIAKALLWLHIGDSEAARASVQAVTATHPDSSDGSDLVPRVVAALCDMADDDYEAAAGRWQALRDDAPDDEMIGVNLAVCLLYVGRMEEGRGVLEGLVDAGYASHTLLFNLSTMYELCTDRSRSLKLQLAQRVAAMEPSAAGWEKTNADFKL